jgi:hypothetical protein
VNHPDEFQRYHDATPDVYRAFCAIVTDALSRGERRLSALWVLYEVRRRWDGKLRFPNAFAPYYARLYLRAHPTPRVFVLKPSKADAAPSRQMDLGL